MGLILKPRRFKVFLILVFAGVLASTAGLAPRWGRGMGPGRGMGYGWAPGMGRGYGAYGHGFYLRRYRAPSPRG